MKLKNVVMAVAASLTAFAAVAGEEIRMVENEVYSVTTTFGIKKYMPSNRDVVRIEKTGETSLRITALKRGRCDLDVLGDMEDAKQSFQFIVGDDLERRRANLSRDLERVPEVQVEVRGDYIRLDGEIKSVKKWNYLMKVLAGYPTTRNFVEFHPGDELLVLMKENLRQSGFNVVFVAHTGKPESWKANDVALTYNKINRTLNVQAKVYTPEQQAQVAECIGRESAWLVSVGKDAKASAADEWKVRLNFQVVVAKPTIRLSVAYMAIGESDLRQIGNSLASSGEAFAMGGAFDIFRDLISDRNVQKTATIGAGLGITTRFLAKNGIGRVSDTGYTLIESWAKDGAKFKSGGTRYVKVFGRDVAELKEIPYGFTIDAKGGMLNETSMSIDFDFGISTIVPMDDGTYDRKEDLSKQKINCPIGRTTLLSGFMDLVDENTPPSGIPFLRSTPMLNWFVAESGKQVSDRRLVIMICPEIVDNTQDAKPDVNKEINIRVQDQASKDTDQVLEEREKASGYTGFWSWLNWFRF
jgi:hypothetical protein